MACGGGNPGCRPASRQRLWEILDINLSDCQQAWMMTVSGEYRRLEPRPEAHGVAVDGTHATLMHLTATAALVTNGDMVVRELPVNQGSSLSFAHAGSNASVADAILERKRT